MASTETLYSAEMYKTGLRKLHITRNSSSWVASPEDVAIQENLRFTVPVMLPADSPPKGAILLLHGLNERSWDKYTGWAEELCSRTGFAVFMVPSAFHIDRAPAEWSRIRSMKPLEQSRRMQASMNGLDPRSVSFINAAISSRIENCPQRFITSGCQTAHDIISLISDIRREKAVHLGISRHAPVHLFGYSAGCTLIQTLLAADSFASPEERLFPHSSRAVLFCGGSALSDSNPVSPYILDAAASAALEGFLRDFAAGKEHVWEGIPLELKRSRLLRSFRSLCDSRLLKEYGSAALAQTARQCLYIPMTTDEVFPPGAVESAAGELSAEIETFRPDYANDHVRPFPQDDEFSESAKPVFSAAASWYVQ